MKYTEDFLEKNSPKVKEKMKELRKAIIRRLPPVAGEMKHSLETQAEAILEEYKSRA